MVVHKSNIKSLVSKTSLEANLKLSQVFHIKFYVKLQVATRRNLQHLKLEHRIMYTG